MTKPANEEDEVLRRMLKTPPKPHVPRKRKKKPPPNKGKKRDVRAKPNPYLISLPWPLGPKDADLHSR